MRRPPMDEALAKIREAAVADLREHWGAAYEIWFEAGQYCAMRRDNGAIVRCGGADGLRREIGTDYAARPVSH